MLLYTIIPMPIPVPVIYRTAENVSSDLSTVPVFVEYTLYGLVGVCSLAMIVFFIWLIVEMIREL